MATAAPITTSVAGVSAALTNWYIPRHFEQIKVEVPAERLFKDMSEQVTWGNGNTATFMVRQPAKRGFLGTETGRLPAGGAPTYASRSFTYPVFRYLISFLKDAIIRGGNERYITSLLEDAVRDVKNQAVRRYCIYTYAQTDSRVITTAKYNGTNKGSSGIVGVVQQALTNSSTTEGVGTGQAVIFVANPWTDGQWAVGDPDASGYLPQGGQYLEEGDFVCIGGDISATDTSAFYQISSIDRSTYGSGYAKVTMTGNFQAQHEVGSPIHFASPSSISSASFNPNDGGAGATLAEQIDLWGTDYHSLAYFAEGGIVHGTARAGLWDSQVNHNGGALRALSFQLIDELVLGMEHNYYHSVSPDTLWMQSGMWQEFLDLAEANHSFFNQDELPLGHKPGANPQYSVAKSTMLQGDLKLVIDKYCPHRTLIAVDSRNVGQATAFAEAEAKEDGSFLRQLESDYDSWAGFIRCAKQNMCKTPAAVGLLKDITQTTTVL